MAVADQNHIVLRLQAAAGRARMVRRSPRLPPLIAVVPPRIVDCGRRHGRDLGRDPTRKAAAGVARKAQPEQRQADHARRPEQRRPCRQRAKAAAAHRVLDQRPAQPAQPQRQHRQDEDQPRRWRVDQPRPREGEQRLVPEIGAVADQANPDQRRAGQQPRRNTARRPMAQDQRGADHGGKSPGAGERLPLPRQRHRGHDQTQPQRGCRCAVARGRRRGQRHQRSGQQLPGARQRKEEGLLGVGRPRPQRKAEAQRAQPRHHQPHRPGPHPQHQRQQQRVDQIELLLDRQAPGVQQRLQGGGVGKVAGLGHEIEVGQEYRRHPEACHQAAVGARRQPEPAHRRSDRQHHEQRGQDAPRPALVKAQDRDAAAQVVVFDQDFGDQIARDHEKDVNPEKAAAETGDPGVKQDHRHHRHRAQPVDVAAILHLPP